MTASPDAPHALFQPLHERITEAMAQLHVPGVAVGMLYDGQEYSDGFGATNAAHPSPVSDDTI